MIHENWTKCNISIFWYHLTCDTCTRNTPVLFFPFYFKIWFLMRITCLFIPLMMLSFGSFKVISQPAINCIELQVLPPVPPVNETLQPHHQMLPVGVVLSVSSWKTISISPYYFYYFDWFMTFLSIDNHSNCILTWHCVRPKFKTFSCLIIEVNNLFLLSIDWPV